MRHKSCVLFFLVSITSLCPSISVVFAKAPATAKIVFAANRVGNREIYLMNPDGSDQINITNHRADDISPSFSPTGEQILFASDRGNPAKGTWDLYLMAPDGSNVQKVFETPAVRAGPTWSPDGKQIAYKRREQGKSFIYISTIDGQKEERVAIGSGPDWSPDGKEIAFLTGFPERVQISILSVSTRKQKVLFPRPVRPSWMGGGVAWSPSGKKLAFSWLHKVPLKDFIKTETVYTLNRDGTELKQIVPEAGPKVVSPVWAPQGDELLYIQADDVQAINLQIFKIEVDGGEPRQLTHIGLGHHLGGWFDPAYALSVSRHPNLLTTTWGEMKQK